MGLTSVAFLAGKMSGHAFYRDFLDSLRTLSFYVLFKSSSNASEVTLSSHSVNSARE
jgi:hypothetical protein